MTEAETIQVIRAALAPARFSTFSPLQLVWDETEREELHWEIFHGQLLGASMTREKRTFRAWNVRGVVDGKPNDEPFVSIKQDATDDVLHVTRGLLCYGQRVMSTGNVIETQEALVWSRELVGSLDPSQLQVEELQRELEHLIFAAIVGTSQLPLTSLEAPLPEFALGRLGYRQIQRLPAYEAKLQEHLLRSPTPIEELIALRATPSFLDCLREVFLGVSLSPYTNFVSRALSLLREGEATKTISAEERIDFLSWLLRLQWRHLNAYDLFLFHHRGANYPDALLVDEVLRELLLCADTHPEAFAGDSARLRRRALRWGWLLRKIYAGHRVPRHPTSPGENSRVLPEPWMHLETEEIENPYRRSQELFREPLALTPRAASLLCSSIEELADDKELREFGTALILDRPIGWSKAIGEPDLTPSLAYIARSRKLALRHIENLERHRSPFFPAPLAGEIRQKLASLELEGAPMPRLNRPVRPGILSLTDAFQTADDFVIERTSRRSIDKFCGYFNWSNIATGSQRWRLIVPRQSQDNEVLQVFDEDLILWLQLEVDASRGFQTRSGIELPVRGLRAKLLSNGQTVNVLPKTY